MAVRTARHDSLLTDSPTASLGSNHRQHSPATNHPTLALNGDQLLQPALIFRRRAPRDLAVDKFKGRTIEEWGREWAKDGCSDNGRRGRDGGGEGRGVASTPPPAREVASNFSAVVAPVTATHQPRAHSALATQHNLTVGAWRSRWWG